MLDHKRSTLILVDSRLEPVLLDVVVDEPVLYNAHAALERYDEPLGNQQLHIIVGRACHPLYLLWVVHEAFVIRPHGQMKVQRLR